MNTLHLKKLAKIFAHLKNCCTFAVSKSDTALKSVKKNSSFINTHGVRGVAI